MQIRFEWPRSEREKVVQTIIINKALVSDLKPMWKIVIPNMRAYLSRAFRRQQDPATDEAWTELSPKYKKWKKKHFPGKRILECTGTLRRAATKKGAPGQIVIMERKSMTFGADVGIYGLTHQTTELKRKDGASRRRPWIGFKLQDLSLMFQFAFMEVSKKLFRRVRGARVRT